MLHTRATHGGDDDVWPTGLFKRGNSFIFRRRVPRRVSSIITQPHFLRTLGDVSLKEAKVLAVRAWAASDLEIEAAEDALAGRSKVHLTPEVIAKIARNYFITLQRAAPEVPWNDEERESLQAINLEQLIELENGPQDAAIQSVARAAALSSGVLAKLTDANFYSLSEAIHSAVLEHHRQQYDRFALRKPTTTDGRFDAVENCPVEPITGQSLTTIVALWAADKTPAQKTRDKADRVVDDFDQVTGSLSIKNVTPDHVQRYKEHLLAAGTSRATARNKLGMLRAIIRFARANRIISSDPCEGIEIALSDLRRKRRDAYDEQALRSVFTSSIYTADDRPRAGAGEAAYWLPLLAIYTGARLNELGQLRVKDVVKEPYLDGRGKQKSAWVIRFVEDEADGLKLKNGQSDERRVPVHAELIKLGFVKFVEAAGEAQQARLFPALLPDKYGTVTAQWSKWYGRHLRQKCGVSRKAITFHSFRHTFKHCARQSKLAPDVQNEITGHETGDVADDYGGFSYPLEPLVDGIRRYRVAELVLPEPPPKFR